MQTVAQISNVRRTLALLALFLAVASCSLFTDPESQQLRVRNVGPTALAGLKVWFPDTAIAYGDIQAGATTGYTDVPGGVYRYSAFSFQHEGAERMQPVIDFVGEEPMKGERFTYDVELIETANGPFIAIREVTRDK